jgi:hypothetical protein
LTSDRGCASLNICSGCDSSDEYSLDTSECWEDFLTCNSIDGDRYIGGSSATAVTSSLLTHISGFLTIRENADLTTVSLPSLTFTGGHLEIYYLNDALATIHLPSLSTVVGNLDIRSDISLTFVHLPKLTFIGGQILFCANNADFLIPSGPPHAPTGGFVVTGPLKGTDSCVLQQGSGSCEENIATCP